MARLNDAKSVRQQVFTVLDGMADVKRQDAVKILCEQFPTLSASYAMTLFQSHRKDRSEKEGGKSFVTIYRVRDSRSNTDTKPYMSCMVIPSPDESDARTKKDAVLQYVKQNAIKNAQAKKLM